MKESVGSISSCQWEYGEFRDYPNGSCRWTGPGQPIKAKRLDEFCARMEPGKRVKGQPYLTDAMTLLGKQGWELTCIDSDPTGIMIYWFKRRK
jgi:hypothetical protein